MSYLWAITQEPSKIILLIISLAVLVFLLWVLYYIKPK